MFAFASTGYGPNYLEDRNMATLQAIYVSAGGSVYTDVQWKDRRPYELDEVTKQVLKRVGEWRDSDKSKSTDDSIKNTSLALMASGKKIPYAQVYVRESWFKQLKTLIKHHDEAVKRGSRRDREEAKAGKASLQ